MPSPRNEFGRQTTNVLGAQIDVISWENAVNRIADWGSRHESRYVCLCNVHSVVTASQDAAFGQVINRADMATADGAPVAKAVNWSGYREQKRVNGPDLMVKYLAEAERLGQKVFFYGSTDATLELMRSKLLKDYPALQIAGMVSPPFRTLSDEEDAAYVEQINATGSAVVFVGLGCPKQEMWMAEHRGRIHAVMVGVGAAFSYYAGTVQRAPVWMQRSGLEWFYRLCAEPGRLWKRYLVTNTLFVAGLLGQFVFGGFVANRSAVGKPAIALAYSANSHQIPAAPLNRIVDSANDPVIDEEEWPLPAA